MAESFNVNLTITSAVGFRRPEYAIKSPKPLMTTTFTLNGETFPDVDLGEIRLLSLSTPDVFNTYPGGTSESQIIEVTNEGNADVTIVAPFFIWSTNGLTPIVDVTPGSLLDADPPVIPVGSTGTFTISYETLSADVREGTYTNWLIVVSDADQPQVKILTTQTVFNSYDYILDNNSTSTTIDTIGGSFLHTFNIVPEINAQERSDVNWNVTATIAAGSDPGWSIYAVGDNYATVRFRANAVNNENDTYAASFLLTANDIEKTVTAQATVDIDYGQFTNYSSWISPASPENSIIGISYDLIQGQRYITVGVGMGADGTTQYNQGGSIFANTTVLSYAGPTYDYPYTAWANVYRFPINDVAQTMYSGSIDGDGLFLYKIKSTTDYNYEYYFGNEATKESMFVVTNDGYGNVNIRLNSLRELSGNTEFDSTLKNLTRAFHYYSDVDSPSRITQLDVAPIKNGTFTHLFNGFNRSGEVLTSIVSLPKSF